MNAIFIERLISANIVTVKCSLYTSTKEKTMDTVTNLLCDIYQAWMKENNLSLGSADEHTDDENLTQEQRDWLVAFVVLWEA